MVVAGVGRERRIGKTLVVAAVCREVEGGESGDEEALCHHSEAP